MSSQPHKRPIDELSSPSSKGPRTRQRRPDPESKVLDNLLSDSAHAILDQDIYEYVRLREEGAKFTTTDPHLLARVIMKSVVEKLLMKSGRSFEQGEVDSLLQQVTYLREMSLEAYNSRSFKDIRNLSIFSPNVDMSEMWSQVVLKRVQPESDLISDKKHSTLDNDMYSLLLKKDMSAEKIIVQLSRGDDSALKEVRLDEADSLLTDNPALENIIQSIKSMGVSFREVRRLVNIRKPSGALEPAVNYMEQASIVKRAWDVDYAGRAHKVLLANINNMDRSGLYSNMVALIQSSGSGKSRMVHEQAKLVFTLPFNLRDRDDTEQLAWPPPDADVAKYFLQQVSSLGDAKVRFLQFFKYLFCLVRKAVLSLRPNGSLYENHAALALAWHEHMEKAGVRSELYGEALELCRADDARVVSGGGKFDDDYVTTVTVDANQELKNLTETLNMLCASKRENNDDVNVMAYLDEVHTLSRSGNIPGDPYNKDMFDILSFCIDALDDRRFFTIFLSTNSHMSQLAPQASQTRSSRLLHNKKPLQAPITETPFDICGTLPIRKNANLVLSKVSEIEFMAQFGRPLFWTYIAGAPRGKKQRTEKGLIEYARRKLLCSSDFHVGHNYFAKQQAALTAVLDTLLNLNFEVGRQLTFAREAELVASHMRVAYSIPSHRQYFRSGYPSEPILAEAAAQQLDCFQTQAPDTNVFATLLQSHFESGLLDQGQRGEVVMRQLILSAYMRACKKDKLGVAHALFSGGCHLVTFIEELFVEDYAKEVLNSRPDNYDDKSKTSGPLREVFKDAIVRFTHFGKMADDTGPSSHTMYAAFIRSMAIICWPSQFAADILIPLLIFKDGVLSEAVMSALMIQVKRRKKEGNYHFTAEELNFFPEGEPRPYITMVAELGVQRPVTGPAATSAQVYGEMYKQMKEIGAIEKPKASSSRTTTYDVFSDAYKTPSKLEVARIPQRRSERIDITPHPHYSIVVHGCSNTVYRVIRPEDRNLYAHLLAHRDFLGEHARQDPDSLAMIRRMKPFWSADGNCYEWIEDDFLNNQPEMTPDTETWLKAGRDTSSASDWD